MVKGFRITTDSIADEYIKITINNQKEKECLTRQRIINLIFALLLMGDMPTNKARTSDNAQKQSASNAVPIFYSVFIVLFYVLCQTIHHPHEADIHIRYR